MALAVYLSAHCVLFKLHGLVYVLLVAKYYSPSVDTTTSPARNKVELPCPPSLLLFQLHTQQKRTLLLACKEGGVLSPYQLTAASGIPERSLL